MRTYTPKADEITHQWWVVDAQDQPLGRLATEVARVLRGKHKPIFTPHLDTGDHVVVVNADKIHVTGRKLEQDVFYWHTGYPGGIKGRTKGEILRGRFPERVLEKAVERMMKKDSPLARQQMKNLRIYKGGSHPHEAQQPEPLDVAALNPKNKRRG